jgi:hypothetical protein
MRLDKNRKNAPERGRHGSASQASRNQRAKQGGTVRRGR